MTLPVWIDDCPQCRRLVEDVIAHHGCAFILIVLRACLERIALEFARGTPQHLRLSQGIALLSHTFSTLAEPSENAAAN